MSDNNNINKGNIGNDINNNRNKTDLVTVFLVTNYLHSYQYVTKINKLIQWTG